MANKEIEPKTEIAKRLKMLREKLNLDRDQIAILLDVTKPTYAHAERGTSFPNPLFLNALASKLAVNLHWLITGDGKMFGNADDTLYKAGGLLDRKRLESAIETVCEALGDHILPPKTMAEIVLIAYDMLQKDENSRDNIIRLVRAA